MTAPGQTTLNIGDSVPVGTALVNLIIMAIITDVNNPNMFGATLQGFQSRAVLTVPALQGIQGVPGQPSFALRFQNQLLGSVDDLPDDLTDEPTDLGKYWVFGVTDQNDNIIATVMYVWYGTDIGFQEFPVGMPGPVGPYPLITPVIILTEPGNGQGPGGVDSWITVTGTASNPSFTFYIAAPQGIVGPAAILADAPDVDFVTNAPNPGDALVCSTRITPGAPSGLNINPLGTGGTFAAGEHFWSVTAMLANGDETLPSNEVGTQFDGTTSSVILTWTPPAGKGAVAYRIYRGTSATNLSVLVAQINAPTTTYTDTGTAGTPGHAPSTGVVEGRGIWIPQPQIEVLPQLFTVPQSAFTSIQGIGASTQVVCTYALPQQLYPWKPYVSGQMQIFGFSISLSPLLVGANVLLGDPTSGVQVAAGSGNNFGVVNLLPGSDNASNTSRAMTPTNNVGLVQANHTGNQGTIYVNLVQQGMAGTYDFNSQGAELVVLVLPCPQPIQGAVLA